MNETEFDICFQRNMQGIELEKADKIEEAMALYELNVSAKFVGSHPYDCLAKYYHARKDYKNEIRVIGTYFSTKRNMDIHTSNHIITSTLIFKL